MPSFVVIIQCHQAHNRCSGFACTHSFYERAGKFEGYGTHTRYISFTCGGCCGRGVAAKMEHLMKKLRTKPGIGPADVRVHLSSCMVTDNHHYDRCPHLDSIKKILAKKGFADVVEGSYISQKATRRREEGVYTDYGVNPSETGK